MKNKERIKMEDGVWKTVHAGPISCLVLEKEKEDLKEMQSNQENVWEMEELGIERKFSSKGNQVGNT